jgi:lysophospholipase L1-like esterase
MIGRLVRAAAKGAALLLVVAAGIELSLQAVALLAVDRHTAWRAGATQRVLCVGDSHTYGAGVRAEEAYPAQLQRVLDEAAPNVYSVVNRGVPGFTTTQVRSRLPLWIDELAPTIVIVIAGTNDVWNAAEMDGVGAGWRARLAAWALHLRTVRFVQSWRAQHALSAELDNNDLPFGARPRYVLGPDGYVDWGDASERILNERREGGVDVATMRQALSNYEEIAHTTNRLGLRLIFLGYPIPSKIFTPFTNAMRVVAMRDGVEFVDGSVAVRRVPPDLMTWTFGLHAGPLGLTEIARDLAKTILDGRPATVNAGSH